LEQSTQHQNLEKKQGRAVSKVVLEQLKEETNNQFKHFTEVKSNYTSSYQQYEQALETLRDENLSTTVDAHTLEEVSKQGQGLRKQIEKLNEIKTNLTREKKLVEELEQQLEKQVKEKENQSQT